MSKAAIVTGASSGIGLAISRVLCEKGYEVYGFGRDFAKEQTRKFVEQTAAFHPVEIRRELRCPSPDMDAHLRRRGKRISLHMVDRQHIIAEIVASSRILVSRITLMINSL